MNRPVDLNDIWLILQELGAALAPVLDGPHTPEWASILNDAMDNAESQIVIEAKRVLAAESATSDKEDHPNERHI